MKYWLFAFINHRPPYYAYRYQALNWKVANSYLWYTKYQFPKYFILEDFDLDIIKSTREHQILQSKNNNIYLSLLGNRGLKIVCLKLQTNIFEVICQSKYKTLKTNHYFSKY